jgi:hypothetical protein
VKIYNYSIKKIVFIIAIFNNGDSLVAQLVEALRYKPEGRGFSSRWGHWNFSVT